MNFYIITFAIRANHNKSPNLVLSIRKYYHRPPIKSRKKV
nr:MAG TPA: hypothetical protein [Bacteriophage sp.]